jgi:hypothetical protein
VLAAAPAAIPPVRGQSKPAEQNAAAHSEMFSGYVAEMSDQSLTVSRKGPNKETVRRVFVMDSHTKVEGKLHMNARVTVRFEPMPDGNSRAVRILVR